MNWLDPIRKAGKVLASVGLVASLAPATNALAVERPCRPYYQCPPGYYSPSSPYYSAPHSASPGAPTPAPGTGGMGEDGGMGDQPGQTEPQAPTDFTPSPEATGRANLAPGMNTPQLGRLDHANRLNLFDNMVAAPVNKVWFGFQYSSGITTGLEANSSFLSFNGIDPVVFNSLAGGFVAEQRQINYRVGAEIMLTQDASIAVQGQYFSNQTDGSFGDDWSNPQIMLKQVLARDCDTVLSATLGITPETGVGVGDFDENTTKIYPGMLYYETLSGNLFTQGGFQFGIPVRDDQISTFDWSVSLGYWLYQDCSLRSGHCCCNQGQITGIVPQVNLLGKHILGDETRLDAFGTGGSLGQFVIYREPQDVLDLSVGTLIIIGSDVQVGLGYSFPITGDETRDSEFISYVNYLF